MLETKSSTLIQLAYSFPRFKHKESIWILLSTPPKSAHNSVEVLASSFGQSECRHRVHRDSLGHRFDQCGFPCSGKKLTLPSFNPCLDFVSNLIKLRSFPSPHDKRVSQIDGSVFQLLDSKSLSDCPLYLWPSVLLEKDMWFLNVSFLAWP